MAGGGRAGHAFGQTRSTPGIGPEFRPAGALDHQPVRATRVLLLCKGLGRGGAEKLVVGSLRYFDRRRFELVVGYLLPRKDALVPEVLRSGVEVHSLGTRGPLRSMTALRHLVRTADIDLVHTHGPYPAVAARLALGRAVRFVHTEHNMWDRYHWATRWGNALTYSRNAAVVTVSQAVEQSIRRHPLARSLEVPMEVLIHGSDVAGFQRGPEARLRARLLLGLSEQDFVVGHVGNFTEKKNQRLLLDAFAQVRERNSAARLVMVGTGPLQASLQEYANQLGVGSHVIWTGMRDDVPDVMPAFDVFVLSSRYEGLPLALLEACAAGIPCVATRVGGVPEILTDGVSGLLVASGDEPAMVEAILRLAADTDLSATIAANGVTMALRYTLGSAVERLQEIYDRVLACGPTPDRQSGWN